MKGFPPIRAAAVLLLAATIVFLAGLQISSPAHAQIPGHCVAFCETNEEQEPTPPAVPETSRPRPRPQLRCQQGWVFSSSGKCIPAGAVECGASGYCPRGSMCIGNDTCLPLSSPRVCRDGVHFCAIGSLCTQGNKCLSVKSPQYCGGRRYCADRDYVCVNNSCWHYKNPRLCSDFKSYCKESDVCTPDLTCLPKSSPRYCGEGRFCKKGQVCAPNGKCYAEGTVYCGKGFCPPDMFCFREKECLKPSDARVCPNKENGCEEGFVCDPENDCTPVNEGRWCGGRVFCPQGEVVA